MGEAWVELHPCCPGPPLHTGHVHPCCPGLRCTLATVEVQGAATVTATGMVTVIAAGSVTVMIAGMVIVIAAGTDIVILAGMVIVIAAGNLRGSCMHASLLVLLDHAPCTSKARPKPNSWANACDQSKSRSTSVLPHANACVNKCRRSNVHQEFW
jgi:hypothetical protein